MSNPDFLIKLTGCSLSGAKVGIQTTAGALPIIVDDTTIDSSETNVKVVSGSEAIPQDLARDIIAAIRAQEPEDQIQAKFGDRLKAAGHSLDQMLSRAGSLASLAPYLQAYLLKITGD